MYNRYIPKFPNLGFFSAFAGEKSSTAGIPDEEKDLIFDRFYRRDKSKNQKEHFGLGLSVAAKLAEIQVIGLDVEDTEGGGSTFRVKIQGR